MPKATLRQEVTVTLEMTEHEAYWLRAMTQNYLGRPGDEPKEDKELREKFFNSLKNLLDQPKIR
ncbi:hypothetical protein F404_gp045 [Vibrio phage pVp-1]|uniref:Uncharacterized protein n=1 Tax=Vibrio phage pVp-1 TaxID=1150989 RepID=H6WXD6_9CAUD|nr:hypothetical protein F404_gp045 [Vibrio phage pVp-1]AFB83902.1 hypothetical protein pVp-1_0045 [Vibrio phage pVp-1]